MAKRTKRAAVSGGRGLNCSRLSLTLAFVSVIFYGFSWALRYFQKSSSLKRLHEQILQITYPGFNTSFGGGVIGLVEAFIYGYVAGAIFYWIYKNIKVR